MSQLDLSVFAEHYKMIALIDRDPESKPARKAFLKNCEALRIPVTTLSRYSIENYVPVHAIKAMYPETPDELIALAPNKKVETQLGFSIKNGMRELAKGMDINDLQGTDLFTFIEKVKSFVEPPATLGVA